MTRSFANSKERIIWKVLTRKRKKSTSFQIAFTSQDIERAGFQFLGKFSSREL